MARRLVFVAIAGLIVLAACSEPATLAPPDPNGLLRSAKSARRSASGSAPTIQRCLGPIVELMTDTRQSLAEGTRCELVEWLAGPDPGARSEDTALSKRMISYCALGIHDLDPRSPRTGSTGKASGSTW